MSSETGTVTTLTTDGEPIALVGWFIYYGTCGVARPYIYPTRDAAWNSVVVGAFVNQGCTCGQPSVPVLLQTSYGGGIRWHSSACLTCGYITGYLDEFEEMMEREKVHQNSWGFDQIPTSED